MVYLVFPIQWAIDSIETLNSIPILHHAPTLWLPLSVLVGLLTYHRFLAPHCANEHPTPNRPRPRPSS